MSHEYKFKNCKNMKRRLTVLLALLVCLVGSVQAQLSKTVELTEAGTLEAQLGEDVGKITELIVKGPLNEADFVTMKGKMKSIQVLDMGELRSCLLKLDGLMEQMFLLVLYHILLSRES